VNEEELARQTAMGSFIAQALGDKAVAKIEIQQAVLQLDNATFEGAAQQALSLLSRALRLPTSRPKVTDLFEIILDAREVAVAIFRTATSPEISYIPSRDNLADSQAMLDGLLRRYGALLVESRSGLGKTREVAELARRLCEEEEWAVCVARDEGDAHMGRPAAFPDELRDRRFLFVLDDLHQRVDSGDGGQESYAERLHAFLTFFEGKVLPGRMYIIATAGTEPCLRRELGFDREHPLWSRFKAYELPEFSPAALQSTLIELAMEERVDFDRAEIAQMVLNSDHTIRTLIANVHRARRRRERLSLDSWLRSEERSYEERLDEARRWYPGVDDVYRALNVVQLAGLPARVGYVAPLAGKLGKTETTAAAEALVDRGLIGLRNGLIYPLGGGKVRDRLGTSSAVMARSAPPWEVIIDAVSTSLRAHQEWRQDFVTIASNLLQKDRYTEAERVVTAAIDCGEDQAEVYYLRGEVRSNLGNNVGAEQDFTKAIALGRDDAYVYFRRALARNAQENYAGSEEDLSATIARGFTGYFNLRGLVRFFQGNYAGAEEDFTALIEQGFEDADDWYWRGVMRLLQNSKAGAEEDLTTALARGCRHPEAYVARGQVRVYRGNYAGAEEDLSVAMARGQDGAEAYFWRGVARRFRGDFSGAAQDMTAAMARGQDDATVYYWRGQVRRCLSDFGGAEEDFNNAIIRDADTPSVYYWRGLARWAQGNHAGAIEDFTEAIERGSDHNALYFRALARFELGDYAGAEGDFSDALAQRLHDADLYYWRGRARTGLGNEVGAEEDFTAAITNRRNDALVYYRRGEVRSNLGNYAGAEQDFTAAILQGQNDSKVYQGRGIVRFHLEDYAGAAADATAAMARGRKDEGIYFARGVARLGQADYAGAAADFTQAIDRGRSDTLVYYFRGQAYANLGDQAGAANNFTAAIERGYDSANVYQLRAFANVRLELLDQARKDCERAQHRAPNDALTHRCWGDLHLALGQPDKAVTSYRAALEAHPAGQWRCELALALLLAGQLEPAQEVYEECLTEASEDDVRAAIYEIDFWTERQAGSGLAPDAKQFIMIVRQKLEAQWAAFPTRGLQTP
jgi:tetratricopeptide (TPR) repeat protein